MACCTTEQVLNIESPDINNTITPSDDNGWHNNKNLQLGSALVMFVVCAVIICGNGLVIIAVAKFKYLHTVTNIFITNLAISDTLLAFSLVTMKLLDIAIPRRLWTIPYVLSRMFYNIALPVSFLILILIGVDRHIAVTKPLQYKTTMTKVRARIAVVSVWLYIISFNIPIALYYGLPVDHVKEKVFFTELLPSGIRIAYTLHVMLGLLLNIILYSHIVYKLWAQQKRMHGGSNAKTTDGSQKDTKTSVANARTRRITKMMVMVVIVLVICWLPYSILSNLIDNKTAPWYMSLIYEFSFCIMSGNSALNPIIYGNKSPDFNKAFRVLLRLGSKNAVQIETSTTDNASKITTVAA